MLNNIKCFLQSAWKYIEEVQTIRAQQQMAFWVSKEI